MGVNICVISLLVMVAKWFDSGWVYYCYFVSPPAKTNRYNDKLVRHWLIALLVLCLLNFTPQQALTSQCLELLPDHVLYSPNDYKWLPLEQTRCHMSMCLAALMTTNDCLEQAGYQYQSYNINMWYNSSFWAKF